MHRFTLFLKYVSKFLKQYQSDNFLKIKLK